MREDAAGEVRIKLHITTKTAHPQVPASSAKLDNSAKYGKLGFEDIEASLRKNPALPTLDLPPLGDYQVKNIWMCLNYSMRPTVSHVIDYVRKYYNYFSPAHDDMNTTLDSSYSHGQQQQQQQQQQLLDDQIKLYLDGYWLPPYESSRLIRENDCIKVDILKPQSDETFSNEQEKPVKQANFNDMELFNNQNSQKQKFGKNDFEKSKQQQQKLTVKEAFVPELKSSNLNKPAAKKVSNEQPVVASCYKKFSVGAYVHLLNDDVKPNNNNNNKTAIKKEQPEQKKAVNSHKYFDDEDDVEMTDANNKQEANDNDSDSGSSSSDSSDGLSEEQVIDDYYQKIKSSKKSSKRAKKMSASVEEQQVGVANINQNDLDKIASNVNATGKNKWKNNKKQTNTNGPKHIVFPSTDSSESPSSTSEATSSSETDSANKEQSETGVKTEKKKSRRSRQKKNKKAQQAENESKETKENVESESKDNQDNQENTGVSGSEKEGTTGKSKSKNRSKRQRNKKRQQQQQEQAAANQEEPATSRYYEPSKEEQLNANPKSLVDFKKIFNQAKLNAPNAEEYFPKEQLENANQEQCVSQKPSAPQMIDLHDNSDMNLTINSSEMSTSTSAESISSASNCDTTNSILNNDDESKAKKSKRHRRRSPRSPKYDFESLEPLRGAPRVDDKLAFQILEISSSFTPEISSYKTGSIVEFDQNSNEVTIKLNSKYHSILNKPSKFSVVLDHDEDQEAIAQSEESSDSLDSTVSSIHDPTIMKIDWRNLMNVKLLPKEQEQPKVQEQPQQ